MTMPKATINENGHADLRPREVRASGEKLVSAPSGQAGLAEQ
jgi:hypothetical protein